jgi:hypothetical protein
VALPEPVEERLVVRVVTLVEVRVWELNVVFREIGTPVPIDAPPPIEVIEEFEDAVARVDVPE